MSKKGSKLLKRISSQKEIISYGTNSLSSTKTRLKWRNIKNFVGENFEKNTALQQEKNLCIFFVAPFEIFPKFGKLRFSNRWRVKYFLCFHSSLWIQKKNHGNENIYFKRGTPKSWKSSRTCVFHPSSFKTKSLECPRNFNILSFPYCSEKNWWDFCRKMSLVYLLTETPHLQEKERNAFLKLSFVENSPD